MTEDQLAELAGINEEINQIPYEALPGPDEPPDWWTDQPMAGRSFVCRDFVQLKADKLKAAGWPEAALTTLLCWTEPLPEEGGQRGYHAVLAVQAGDPIAMILDSRFDEPYPMDAPPVDYQWDRRQIAGTTNFEAVG